MLIPFCALFVLKTVGGSHTFSFKVGALGLVFFGVAIPVQDNELCDDIAGDMAPAEDTGDGFVIKESGRKAHVRFLRANLSPNGSCN